MGNLIEFNVVEYLDDQPEFEGLGKWLRQDPGFPDAIFEGVYPRPGFEIKAWFPLSTEITARFKDSQNHFKDYNTNICLLAWLPERILFGKPQIVDVVIVSGRSVAEARDNHYHNPPDYIVMEPENTQTRTSNLQQTNTNGYKVQTNNQDLLTKAEELIDNWGSEGRKYCPSPDYQAKLRELFSMLPYRLDTNYAKMDRIVHPGLEEFKTRVLESTFEGMTAKAWDRLFRSGDDEHIKDVLEKRLGIKEEDADQLLE